MLVISQQESFQSKQARIFVREKLVQDWGQVKIKKWKILKDQRARLAGLQTHIHNEHLTLLSDTNKLAWISKLILIGFFSSF